MSRINFHLSGSIAAFKACEVISALIKQGHEVQPICTASALKFIGPATLEGLTGKPVLSDLFEPGRHMDHIRLVKWADLSIVCPATADLINKLAAGIADTATGALFLAHDFSKPWLIAPAMNPAMYGHPITQSSLAKLAALGVRVLATAKGIVACGDVGLGRLLEPSQLLTEITHALLKKSSAHPARRILVTAGGTREPIDGVRCITNLSTGATGAVIADELLARGHNVVYLHGEGAKTPSRFCECQTFGGFSDIDQKMREQLQSQSFDAVIHLAAVSDFSVDQIETAGQRFSPENFGKMPSTDAPILHLKKNFKIIDHLREYSQNKKIQIIGFKLTHSSDPAHQQQAIAKLQATSKVDLIVHNDASNIQGDQHMASLFQGTQLWAQSQTKTELAQALARFIEEKNGETL